MIGWLVFARDGSWRVDQVRPELTAILHEIERAIEAKLYYVAIAVALSVPDICACLESNPDKPIWATFEKYAAWCDANLEFRNLDGTDLARLRGGVLHQGHFGHPKSKFNRVLFIGPESLIKAHDVIMSVGDDVFIGGVSAIELRVAGAVFAACSVQMWQDEMIEEGQNEQGDHDPFPFSIEYAFFEDRFYEEI